MKTEKKQKTPVMAAAVDNAVEENQLLSCLNSAINGYHR